jgi:hypothetical protein
LVWRSDRRRFSIIDCNILLGISIFNVFVGGVRMNKEKWEQISEEVKPLLQQLSDIAIKYKFGIFNIGIDEYGYISSFLIEDQIHYNINKMCQNDCLEIDIRDYQNQEAKR